MRYIIYFCFVLFLSNSLFGQLKLKKPKLSGDELSQRIEEGYRSVDSPEPYVTAVEKELLEKIYALFSSDPDYAYTFLQETLDSDLPVSAAFNHALGNLYFRNRNYFQAENQYLAAVQKHKSFRRAWNSLGLARYKQGSYESAAEALGTSVRFGANDAMTFGILGYCHLQLGRYRSAETAYHFAMLFEPDQTDWAEGIAQAYYETARYEEAISVFDDLLRTDPNNSEFWLMKANAWLALDKPLKTAQCLEIARRVGDIESDSLYLLGNVYLEQGIFELARKVFLSAAEDEDGLNQKELLNAVRYLVFNDKHEFAEEIFAHLKDESSDWTHNDKTMYRFLKAEFSYFRGDVDQSEAEYLHGLELDPFNSYALMKLASISIRNENTDQAIVYYDRAAADPAQKQTALLSKAIALINNKQYRFALKTLEEVMKESDDNKVTRLHAQVQRLVDSGS
ncbi:tetratricopeptide repeat protein [Pelagicoccus mobilis]|uniref:Tetratricopeptide repeat protein n=1 Tax=Pelagicoccus mobilis TaxID=415221 RepID=A0A934VTC2_9BACT|nr:tetratricopeptide repeat protein [Pelagicoccus mobilis]MBK1879920.1 tetratricopeptide repeat protein [Pelagicoccus mobilis]